MQPLITDLQSPSVVVEKGGRGGIPSGSWKCNDGNDPIGDTPAFH